MIINGCHLICDENKIVVGKISNNNIHLGFSNFSCKGAETGILIKETINTTVKPEVRIAGGEAVILVGSGIILGKKAQVMHCKNLKVWINK